jgi:hypothetical protein
MPDCDLDRSVTFCLQRSVPNRECNSESAHYSNTPLLRSAGFEDDDDDEDENETDLTQ